MVLPRNFLFVSDNCIMMGKFITLRGKTKHGQRASSRLGLHNRRKKPLISTSTSAVGEGYLTLLPPRAVFMQRRRGNIMLAVTHD